MVPPQPAKRRKKKLHERDLLERLKRYENIMTQNGVNFESALDGGHDVVGWEDETGSPSPGTGTEQYRDSKRDDGRK